MSYLGRDDLKRWWMGQANRGPLCQEGRRRVGDNNGTQSATDSESMIRKNLFRFLGDRCTAR